MSVRTRILMGFLVVLALVLLVSGAAYVAFTRSSTHVRAFVQQMEIRSVAQQLDREGLVLRGVATQYAELGDEAAANTARSGAAHLQQRLAAATAVAADAERHKRLADVSAALANYMDDFEHVAQLKAEQQKLIREGMDTAGLRFYALASRIDTTDLSAEGAAAVDQSIRHALLAQLSANQMIGRRDPTFAARAKEQFRQLHAKLDELEGQLQDTSQRPSFLQIKSNLRQLKALAPQYETDFERVVAINQEIDRLITGSMAEHGRRFADNLSAVVESATAAGARAETSTLRTAAAASRLLLGLSLGGLVAGTGIAWLLGGAIARPVKRMTEAMKRLADGDRSIVVPALERRDEIGQMAAAVQVFKENAVRIEELSTRHKEGERQAAEERREALTKLADTFETQVGAVIEAVTAAATQLQTSAQSLADSAAKTSDQAANVTSAAGQASANTQTVASATEELTAAINEIAGQVKRSRTVAERANSEAVQTTELIQQLSDNVNGIGAIVALINSIAAQTNLLALNATIEAARAGEAGRGFAVVASEVKTLAGQTAKATDEIAHKITAVQNGTASAVKAITSIAQVNGEMSEISGSVASAVQQQSSATAEIARNIEQAAAGTQSVSRSIGAVELAARETGTAAGQINGAARDLSGQADRLKRELEQFLNGVRADTRDMQLVAWDDRLATGIPEIDAHHRQLFDNLNEYFRTMMRGEGAAAATTVLETLVTSMHEHFAEEEREMERLSYPALAEHRRAHQAFWRRADELRANVAADTPGGATALLEFFADWLQSHLANVDKPFAAFALERRAA
jgi:methyl-accepting chemotaxis protein